MNQAGCLTSQRMVDFYTTKDLVQCKMDGSLALNFISQIVMLTVFVEKRKKRIS